MIKWSCACGKHLSAPAEKAGTGGKCPQCGERIVVPGPATTPPPGAAGPGPRRPEPAPAPAPRRRLVGRTVPMAWLVLVAGVLVAVVGRFGRTEVLESIGGLVVLSSFVLALIGSVLAVVRRAWIGLALGGVHLALGGVLVAIAATMALERMVEEERLRCGQNLRQLHVSLLIELDRNGRVELGPPLVEKLAAGLEDPGRGACPDSQRPYATWASGSLRDLVVGRHGERIPVFWDAVASHRDRRMVVFGDGRVEVAYEGEFGESFEQVPQSLGLER